MLMLGSTLRAYFLCTACLLTPSMSAIACQLSPARRAASTWHSSRRSVSCRRAATARSPARGSAVSVACETISCGSMMSTVVAICSHVNLGCQTRPPATENRAPPTAICPTTGASSLSPTYRPSYPSGPPPPAHPIDAKLKPVSVHHLIEGHSSRRMRRNATLDSVRVGYLTRHAGPKPQRRATNRGR